MKDIKRILDLIKNRKLSMLGNIGKDHDAFQTLVAASLSARTKDTTTLPIVVNLFKRYKKPEDFLRLNVEQIERLIYPVGFYRTKARNLKKLSETLIKNYRGKVPGTIEELTKLPGVGRKTANCVLVYSFKKQAIPVDVHVHRISNRIGLVKTKTPEETEQALMKTVDKRYWNKVNETFVIYGQTVCLPINPKCSECKIRKYCDYGSKKL